MILGIVIITIAGRILLLPDVFSFSDVLSLSNALAISIKSSDSLATLLEIRIGNASG